MAIQRTRGGLSRRQVLGASATATALVGGNDFGFLRWLPPVAAAETSLPSSTVRFSEEVEPLVRLLEETPREQVVDRFAEKILRGSSYRDVLAAILLAGVRNVQPRPSVGFKFHTVLVVNACHLASLASAPADRWLPIFWALDYFKSAQASDVREGDWTMAAPPREGLPAPAEARVRFEQAMDSWDESAADAAAVSFASSAGANELFDVFARYGARDFRSIGHKAIYVANGWRTLQTIGWNHAEPVVRSLTYALLNHENDPLPHQADLAADRPGRENVARAARLRDDWQQGGDEDDWSDQVVTTLRTATPEEAAERVVDLVNRGAGPRAVWDGLFLSAGELLMRQPGIIGLHTLTTTNALHFAFQTCGDEATRKQLMLQNASFLPMFRERMPSRGGVGEDDILSIDGAVMQEQSPASVLEAVGQDGRDAVRKAYSYLHSGGSAKSLMGAARALIFAKGTDSHDYKFSSAVLEDFHFMAPSRRDRLLAASMVQLRGSGARDNPLIERVRNALA